MLPPNLAAYLDEAGDDPVAACAVVARSGLRHVVLRRLWSAPIAQASDAACQKVAAALRKHDLQVVAVATDCGRTPVQALADQTKSLQRALLIAAYFRAKYIRIFAGLLSGGTRPAHALAVQSVHNWLNSVRASAQAVSITPVIEIDPDAIHFELAEVKDLLDNQPGLYLQYDPALLVLRRAQDPTIYWHELRRRIALVDLHDYQLGRAFRPLGHGDCRWKALRADLIQSPQLWLLLEPGLGRTYGQATTRAQTFGLAVEAFTAFWDGK